MDQIKIQSLLRTGVAILAFLAPCQHVYASACTSPPKELHVKAPINSSYRLTFDEEFNGSSIDTSKWQIPNGNIDHTYNTYSNARFASSNIKVASGQADFQVTRGASGNYYTAAATSYSTQKYGYWEARVSVPTHADGIGADFWIDTSPWVRPEIDVTEWLGEHPLSNQTTWHYAAPVDGGNAVGISAANAIGNTGSGGFHVFGMLWTPQSITWYLDGVQTFQTTTHVNAQNATPQWVILDATVGGFNGNLVDATTVFPSHYLVDYVHVYSSDPEAVAVKPEAGYMGAGDAGLSTCS